MRRLLACTCLTPFAFAAATQAHAERKVETAITTPLATSTATNGAPDDINVTSAGKITLTTGTGITIDSNNSVTNAGTIGIQGANNAIGILAQAGRAGNVTNSGTITIDEDYTATDTDKDGDVDGPFAQGNNRFGIRIAPGGTFTGNVANSGKINIEGNDSAGLAVDSRLAGSLNSSGTINVTGDRSVGVRAGEVTGNVRIAGVTNVTGQGAIGVALDGNIGGALVIQGAVASTGYRSTTAPADTSKLDADDLLQGGPAIRITGDVAGGIRFAVAPPDNSTTDDDEDDDGIKDAEEGSAAIASFGAAPAVVIGSATRAVTIGAAPGDPNGHGLVIDGSISGSGVYAGVDGRGLVIGGLGGNVSIGGGMTVNGTVAAASIGGNATAVQIGAGASVPQIRVGGVLRASGGPDAADTIRALQIDQGATVTTIRNSGAIEAVGGKDANIGAIVDRSGGVSLIENSGAIVARGGTSAASRNIAIDLSANNAGTTIRQFLASATAKAPRMEGEILLGGGDDLVDIAAGAVIGTARFGAGADRLLLSGSSSFAGRAEFGTGADRLTLGGTSSFSGTADFGGGADLLEIGATASFRAAITNGAGLAVTVNGGTFAATQAGEVDLASLALGAGSRLGVDIDAAAGTHTLYDVAGTASVGTGVKLDVRLANVVHAVGRYTFLRAGTLTGGTGAAFDENSLPILFRGTVEASTAGNGLDIVIARRTAADLGLNRSATSAYDAVFASLDNDEDIASSFLALRDRAALRAQVAQMLPDHSGGVFETVTLGSRATARFLADPNPRIADMGGWGFWLQQVGWGTSKDLADTAAYDVTGWGASGGVEGQLGGAGRLGLSLAYLNGRDTDEDNDNEVRASQFEVAGHWRLRSGPFGAFARASAAFIDFDGARHFAGVDGDGQAVLRTADGNWKGRLYSAAAGISYEIRAGRLTLRPAAGVDYYRLNEGGYSETGGGDGFNLIVEDRNSDELAATGSLAAGLNFGSTGPDAIWFRTEIEGGRRQILAGSLGPTVAHFDGGNPFTIAPDRRTDGWTGALRVTGGTAGFVAGGEVFAEEQGDHMSVAFRVSVGFGF